ncbi:MAG TPA: TetR/AcrR family transcriptional regulator [Conexibacter sp.]
MARPHDPEVTEAIEVAALELLGEHGFAQMSVAAVAERAGVGKPAIYRRFSDKAALVASVVARRLPALEVPELGDTHAELWRAVQVGFPQDGPGYVALIGGLIAEEERHPELIDAFRRNVLAPRREAVRQLIERGQARGDVRRDLSAESALDLLAGPFLARVFAGAPTGPRWRRRAFELWWDLVRERPER